MQNGAVVNVSSLSAIQVNVDSPAYNVSKAAQDHLTKTFAKKYTGQGVRINSVNPGFVRASPCLTLLPRRPHLVWLLLYTDSVHPQDRTAGAPPTCSADSPSGHPLFTYSTGFARLAVR